MILSLHHRKNRPRTDLNGSGRLGPGLPAASNQPDTARALGYLTMLIEEAIVSFRTLVAVAQLPRAIFAFVSG